MNSSLKKFALVAAPIVVLLAVLFFVFRGGDDDLTLNQPAGVGPKAGAEAEADPEYIMVGGVRRKATDVKPVKSTSQKDQSRPRLNVGVNQPVPKDANKNVASVAESLRDKSHPERLSSLIRPAAFNRESFDQDPQAYLDVIEPGRVFQTAQPGAGIEVLRQLSPRYAAIKQGESVKLRVMAVPRAPVTFHSFDLGRFATNQLTTLTVVANDEGIAEAEFVGSEGTYNTVNILAGSPMTTGQVKFIVHVEILSQGVIGDSN